MVLGFPPSGPIQRRSALIRAKTYRMAKKIYCARILIEGARFPPFGFDTAEIRSNSNEIMILESSGVILGSLWGHFGVTLGSLWGDFGTGMGPPLAY